MALSEIAEIAARYDTVMSWAMLRCLLAMGVSVKLPKRREHAHDHDRFAELEWCFENHGSPMDGVR